MGNGFEAPEIWSTVCSFFAHRYSISRTQPRVLNACCTQSPSPSMSLEQPLDANGPSPVHQPASVEVPVPIYGHGLGDVRLSDGSSQSSGHISSQKEPLDLVRSLDLSTLEGDRSAMDRQDEAESGVGLTPLHGWRLVLVFSRYDLVRELSRSLSDHGAV